MIDENRPPHLVLHSAIAQLPEQAPALHQWELPDGSPWCVVHKLDRHFRMRFPGLADFHIDGDGRVDCFPAPGISQATLLHLFSNQVVPASLSLQHRAVFHASALTIGDKGVAFLGESGRGKSTLATFLARRGHRLLTDDGLELRQSDETLLALPNQPSIRLWEDSRAALLPATAQPLPAVSYTSKARFQVDQLLPFADTPAPLHAALFLGDGQVDTVILAPLSAQQAHLAWIKHAFLLNVHDKDTMRRLFLNVADLVNRGLSYCLDYPRRYDVLPQVEACLLALLEDH